MLQIVIEKRGAQPIVFSAAICLVVLAMVWILMANFIGVPSHARAAKLRLNMRIIQLAADDYAGHHNRHYADSLQALSPYLPGGSHVSGGRSGALPENPYSPEHTACVDGFAVLGSGGTIYPGQVVYFGRQDKYVITAIGQAVSLSPGRPGLSHNTSTSGNSTLARLRHGVWFQNLSR